MESTNGMRQRRAHEAEARCRLAAENAIRAQCPGQPINFAAARERELARVQPTEPSALTLERERRRNRQAEA